MQKSFFSNFLKIIYQHTFFIFIISFFLTISLYWISYNPVQSTWGDEDFYTRESHRFQSKQELVSSFIPGNMPLYWWPPFANSVYGLFAEQNISRQYAIDPSLVAPNFKEWSEDLDYKKFIKKVSYFNLLLYIITAIFLYIISLKLGLSKLAANIVNLLFISNVRLSFYIQALWPEILHMFLLITSLLLLILFAQKKHILYLISSGVLLGYCALVKGIVSSYVPILSLIVFFLANPTKKIKALLLTIVFFLSYKTIVFPQKYANLQRYNQSTISTNKWTNIEQGLGVPANSNNGQVNYKNPAYIPAKVREYYKSSSDLFERESLSKKRVIEYLKETPITKIIQKQLYSYSRLLNDSFLARGIRVNRWENFKSRNSNIRFRIDTISVLSSWFLLIFGISGAIVSLFGKDKLLYLIISSFLFYYLSALLIVNHNSRFFIPLIPLLAIFSGKLIQDIINKSQIRFGRTNKKLKAEKI